MSYYDWVAKVDLIDGEGVILTLPLIPDDSPQIRSGGFRCTFTSTADLWERSRGGYEACYYFRAGFAKGLRSEYFEVVRDPDIAGLRAEQHRTEIDVLRATQVFQAKAKDIRKKDVEAIEEQGDLGAPNSCLRRLRATTHPKDFSDKKQFLRNLISLQCTLKPDGPNAEDDAKLQHVHAAVKQLIRKAAAATRSGVVSWNMHFEG
ncbi:Hypothetical protein NCS54_00892800 [Fusarium falciforme]|uniref:Hypothetical protein n=1 Tax=Fusarium falciforme TaxID=195108 RepID=UPI002300D464|nr:Hypothetical protein NCS54_00892800 [Fusarium falciforme]WAO91457.1 Hypothetical protein NCS54_00892800 [Fusarium falciforme]